MARGNVLQNSIRMMKRTVFPSPLLLLPPWLLGLTSLVLSLLLLPPKTHAVAQQEFRRTPDNQTATIGDTVTLACSIINKSGTLQWTRDGFGLGTERNLVGYERYRMVMNEEEGDFTLVIDHVTLEDDAVFQCQVGPGDNGVRELRSPNAKLTVEVPTGPPQILQGNILHTTEDREIQLQCISRGGKPAAEITWIDGSGQEIKTGVETVKEELEDGKRYNALSILKLSPKKEHHNKTFTCQAHNRPAKEVMSTFIRLEVKYAPKVTLKTLSKQIKEYDNVKFSCRADGNPPEMVYRWFMNDQVVAGDWGTTFTLHNVTRLNHEAVVKCEVQNSVGKGEDTYTLKVLYGPVFRKRPRNVQADPAESKTLTCDVEGNPSPEIVWFHEQTRVAVSTAPNLTITVTPDTAGRYICQAVVQGFPEISAEAVIMLKGKPKILSQRIQMGSEGDTVRLECRVQSIPRPERISWSHMGHEIDSHDPEYTILEDPLPDGVKSTLVIRTSQEKDFGPYNCSVKNEYGIEDQEIYLMKQKSGQLVVILTCVIGGVVVIVAITMISLLCQRKAKKPDFLTVVETDGMEKQTNKSDRSSNDSDLKVEIRTASSLSNIQEHDSEHWDDGGSDALKNESLYRYSDYIDPVFPPKPDGHNNNGYVPYVDYTRDYNPPSRNNLYSSGPPQQPPVSSSTQFIHHQQQLQSMSNHHPSSMPSPPQYPTSSSTLEHRYSANYGNPYLRSSNSSLPPNVVIANNPSPTNSQTTFGHPSSSLIHGFSNHNHSNHSNHIGNSIPMTTTPSSHYPNSIGGYGVVRNGAVPQQGPRSSNTPSPQSQYIVPTQPQLKPGTLATHV